MLSLLGIKNMSKKKDKNSRKKIVKNRSIKKQGISRKKEMRARSAIEQLNYKITFDPLLDDEPDLPADHVKRKEAIYHQLIEFNQNRDLFTKTLEIDLADELIALIEKYPADKTLTNYLTNIYKLAGDDKKYIEYTKQCLEKLPDYLYNRFQMGLIYIDERNFQALYELFEGKFDLKTFVPERNVFHVTEATSMFVIAAQYYDWSGDNDAFLFNYELLKELQPNSPILIKLMPKFMMLRML